LKIYLKIAFTIYAIVRTVSPRRQFCIFIICLFWAATIIHPDSQLIRKGHSIKAQNQAV